MGAEDYRDYPVSWAGAPPVSPFSWDAEFDVGRGGAFSWAPDRFSGNGWRGPGDGFGQRPRSDNWLPPGVPALLDALPPSRWTDLQCFDRLDRSGNIVRQFADGNRVLIAGNPPRRVLIVNPTTTKEIALDPYGRIVQAIEINNNNNGSVRNRNDCIGGVVDGYGAIHGVNGRVERRNGLISPNERAYVHGLKNGFPERWAFLPRHHNNQFQPEPYYQQPPGRFCPQSRQQFYEEQFHPRQVYEQQLYEQQLYQQQLYQQQLYRQQLCRQQFQQQQNCMPHQRFFPQQQVLPQMLMQLLTRQGMQFMRHSGHHHQHQIRMPRGRRR